MIASSKSQQQQTGDVPKPAHQQCALLYPVTVIAEIALTSFQTILLFGILWIVTRLVTGYAYLSMLLIVLLVKSMDFLVVACLDGNRAQDKILYHSKYPVRTWACLVALAILASRSIGPLLFSAPDRVRWWAGGLFIVRVAALAFSGTFIAGMRYLPYLGYMRASSFPLLVNTPQMYLRMFWAALRPDNEQKIQYLPRRYANPTLLRIIMKLLASTVISGLVLGALYEWTNPTYFVIFGVPCLVEASLSTVHLEINPDRKLAWPWEGNIQVRTMATPLLCRLGAFAMASLVVNPGYKTICIYFIVSLWMNLIDILIRNSLVNQLDASLSFLPPKSNSAKAELVLFLSCILGDQDMVVDAICSSRPMEEFRQKVLVEIDRYDRLASKYALSLEQPSHRAEDCFSEDLQKLAALKSLAHATTDTFLSIDKVSPPICRVVCVFLGGLGLNLQSCNRRASDNLQRGILEWRLAPAFFVAVRWGLDAIKLQFSEQTYDTIVLAPVALIAMRTWIDGADQFIAHDPSATTPLEELKDLCNSTAIAVMRAARATLRSAEKIENFLDPPTIAWLERIEPMHGQFLALPGAARVG